MENIPDTTFPNEVSRSWRLSQRLDKPENQGRGLTIWVPDLRSAYTLKEHLLFFKPHLRLFVLPPFETDLLRNRGPSIQRKIERIRAFYQMTIGEMDLLIVPVEGLFQKAPSIQYWKLNSFTVSLNEALSKTTLAQQLGQLGYLPTELVEQPFQYSVRGSIVDIFCPLYDFPIRLELFEDEVQSIRSFFPESQRKNEDLSQVTVVPTHEFLWPRDDTELSSLRSAIRLKLDTWDWDKSDREAFLNRIDLTN